MGQSRNRSGRLFEEIVCEKNDWTHSQCSPKLNWECGSGGINNLEKIYNINFDHNKFLLNIDKSIFDKYDAIDQYGGKIEIKKYSISHCKNKDVILSEPIFKVANQSTIEFYKKRGLSEDEYREKYNLFLNGVVENIGTEIIDKVVGSFIGICFTDGFVETKDINFFWSMKKGWRGFNRYTIMFRIK